MTYTKEAIYEELQTVLSEMFGFAKDNITLSTHARDDLDLDSIDLIDLAVKLEERLGKKIPKEKFAEIHTVSDFVDILHLLLQEK